MKLKCGYSSELFLVAILQCLMPARSEDMNKQRIAFNLHFSRFDKMRMFMEFMGICKVMIKMMGLGI